MFPNRVYSKLRRIEFVRVNMDRLYAHDGEFFRPFRGMPLLLITEPIYDNYVESLCMFPVAGGISLMSSAICAIEEVRKDNSRYGVYTVDNVDCYSTEIRMNEYFGAGVGLVGIEDYLLDRLTDIEAGKYMLERL